MISDRTALFIKKSTQGFQFVRFVVSGGVAFCVNVTLLYFFTDILGFWYIYSATLSFVFSLLVGFSLNKLWTFKNTLLHQVPIQFSSYLSINIFNLILNNTALFTLVEEFGVWYILAQAIISIIIAFESYFVYKFIFRNKYQPLLQNSREKIT